MEKLLEKAGKITLEWGANNSVTYNMGKSEVVLFSKAHHQKLAKQISEIPLRFGRRIITCNNKATWY